MKKLIYRAVLIAAAVFCICACEQEPEEQTETEEPFIAAPEIPPEDAIPIANAEDLAKIGKDSAFPLSGAYKLEEDISASGWTPIGGAKNFTGAFYGMNNTITITSGKGGVFASLRGATIYNLKVNITASANGGSIGGIANYAENSLIKGCSAAVTLTLAASGHNASAGGIVGSMKNNVTVSGCTASGDIKLTSGTDKGLMVYAGGVAGYNSGYATTGTKASSSIENCYSTAAVVATSTSKAAFAGGITGANAKGAIISKCYARGAVTAKVAGNGANDLGGSIGPMVAANAGGIAGAQYYYEKVPAIEYCAALNTSITGTDSASSGAVWNIYRIAGKAAAGYENVRFTGNIAYSGMTVTNHSGSASDKTATGKDGADTGNTPGQGVYAGMGWDFDTVWQMSGDYPVLR